MPIPLEDRVAHLEREVASVKDEVGTLKRGVDTNNVQTAEMYEVFNNLRGGFKVIEWIGRMAVPVAIVSAFVTAGYIFMRTGVWVAPTK